MRRRLRMMMTAAMQGAGAGASDPVQDYIDLLINTYGASEVWPLVDIESGTTITASVNAARNGTLVGWDLQNAAGPVTGSLAPFSDGANDYGNILTDSLKAIADGNEMSVFFLGKMNAAAVWTDAANRYLYNFIVDGQNYFRAFKTSTDNQLRVMHEANDIVKSAFIAASTTDWFSIGHSYSLSANEMIPFFNGSPGATIGFLGTFTSNPLTTAAIGSAAGTVASLVHHGWMGFLAVKFGGIWTPTQFQEMHDAGVT